MHDSSYRTAGEKSAQYAIASDWNHRHPTRNELHPLLIQYSEKSELIFHPTRHSVQSLDFRPPPPLSLPSEENEQYEMSFQLFAAELSHLLQESSSRSEREGASKRTAPSWPTCRHKTILSLRGSINNFAYQRHRSPSPRQFLPSPRLSGILLGVGQDFVDSWAWMFLRQRDTERQRGKQESTISSVCSRKFGVKWRNPGQSTWLFVMVGNQECRGLTVPPRRYFNKNRIEAECVDFKGL